MPPEGPLGGPLEGMAFDVDLGAHGEYAVVHVKGALDWATSPSLRVTVEHLWDFLGGGHLILNLGQTSFCDSMGVGVLVVVLKGCQERGVRLVLAATPVSMLRMLTVAGLVRLFEIRDTLEEALEAVAGREPEAGSTPASVVDA